MKPIQLRTFILLASIAVGCASQDLPKSPWTDARTADLPGNPHDGNYHMVTQDAHLVGKPAAPETQIRVVTLGNKILDANKDLGLRPAFMTAGLAKPAITHQDTKQILVSEALVNLCPSDTQLAAVLCAELGKMVAERQTQANLMRRLEERPEPTSSPVGSASMGGTPDRTDVIMDVKVHGDRRTTAATSPANPETLARSFLRKAGFAETDLDSARDILKQAEANSSSFWFRTQQ